MIKVLRNIIAFPFRIGLYASLPLIWIGIVVSFIAAIFGPLAILAEPIQIIFMIPYYIFEFLYSKIHG